MRRVAQKWMSLAMAAIMLFAACFGGIGSAKVYAAESAGLSIYRESDEGEPVKTYTVEELRTRIDIIIRTETSKSIKAKRLRRNLGVRKKRLR